MRDFANQLVRDLAAWLGAAPYDTLDGLGALLAFCHFATLIPVCGAFVPNRLGLGAWIRLWPYSRRPMLVYGAVEFVLLAATALIVVSDIPKPFKDSPETNSPRLEYHSTKNSAKIRPQHMALAGLALPGMFMGLVLVGLMAGQPNRRLRANLDRAGATHRMDALMKKLTTDHGWKLIRHWHANSQSQIWWLGQSMPLTGNLTGEAQLGVGHLLASPRRSLFIRLVQSPQGATLEADLRILDIVLTDTKVRETAWINMQLVELERVLKAQGAYTTP